MPRLMQKIHRSSSTTSFDLSSQKSTSHIQVPQNILSNIIISSDISSSPSINVTENLQKLQLPRNPFYEMENISSLPMAAEMEELQYQTRGDDVNLAECFWDLDEFWQFR